MCIMEEMKLRIDNLHLSDREMEYLRNATTRITILFSGGNKEIYILSKKNNKIGELTNILAKKHNVYPFQIHLFKQNVNEEIINKNTVIENNSNIFCIISVRHISFHEFFGIAYYLKCNFNMLDVLNIDIIRDLEYYQKHMKTWISKNTIYYNNLPYDMSVFAKMHIADSDTYNTNLDNIRFLRFEKCRNIFLPNNIFNIVNNLSHLSMVAINVLQLNTFVELFTQNTLTHLTIEMCNIINIPPELSLCTNLTHLNLVNTQLNDSDIDFIYDLIRLEKINLSGNQITRLLSRIGNLVNLKELRLINNQLSSLPDEIFYKKKAIIIRHSQSINDLNKNKENNQIELQPESNDYLRAHQWHIQRDSDENIIHINKF